MNGFKKELTENILPFWSEKMIDNEHGGFYGRIDGHDMLHRQANKGAILNARILWTFSAAYRLLKNEKYRRTAQRAFDYIVRHFIDKEYGGAYWELDYQGNPVNTKKQTYVQGFMLYGFSEFYRATGDSQALQRAVDCFHWIEDYRDRQHGGYFEAFTRDWQPIDDMRLSDKDANEKKSMNTHLHILEPYTNLLRVWKNDELATAQRRLIDLFTQKILDRRTHHLSLFFDEAWQVKSSVISYGHDIECSWLLYEAAEVLSDTTLMEPIRQRSLEIAEAATEGLQSDGSLLYEKDGNHEDRERHWWVQAEAVVGFMTAYANSGESRYKDAAAGAWRYIRTQLIDPQHGEWYWSRLADGSINRKDDKAGFWKCPYHNGRLCMEMIERFQSRQATDDRRH
ncbi:MAG TPA: N-acyl-D-glucosamine 2-epimerase [Porphyromonadaceae bacterium]|jgi:mannobiose 2-epimerase|nr:N-acyl-D-glucosamine 2-epimerase [Porphyromonadaceae bacterium]HBL34013.1 N-acyl-D-glucosamine 2-epimerase [Porphyromonadaceae bacterium]HCM22313.1 N-acyl-D-glucosamine 2-epimerase [Porphyromonadaceae bacterium]